jgi:protein TonB
LSQSRTAPAARPATLEFLLPASLPAVGDAHPLRRRYLQRLTLAFLIAVSCHLVAFTGFLIHRVAETASLPGREFVIDRLPQPRPLAGKPLGTTETAIVAPLPKIGLPEPVADFQAPDLTMPDNDALGRWLDEHALPAIDGGMGRIVLDLPPARPEEDPGPGTFVAFEEPPVLVRLPAPVYPEMARQAEVEGTVLVQVLVGRNGRVKEARTGPDLPMLREAALAAAREAVFKPALQQHRPVAVWLVIPMRFTLH